MPYLLLMEVTFFRNLNSFTIFLLKLLMQHHLHIRNFPPVDNSCVRKLAIMFEVCNNQAVFVHYVYLYSLANSFINKTEIAISSSIVVDRPF